MDDAQLSSAVAIAEAVRRGDVSALEVADRALAAIRERDGALHAFLTVDEDNVRAGARAVDDRRARGETLGPLAGVPVALKDAICTRGTRTTAGSRILEDWVPPYDATVVSRLEAAGAVRCGKTNMDELAMGSSTENSAFGPTRNPVDADRAPGGSSGGSAVAVAAAMTPVSLGSDTGGSVRQPAAFTGTLAIKPTYGRVSRFGLVAFASSLDQIAPFARDVRSLARVLGVIAGKDPKDATTLDAPVDAYEAACEGDVRGVRIGVPAEYFGEGLESDVGAAVQASLARLERRGALLVPISLPHTRHAVATYYVLATAEASSNLARFDGVRFGLRVEPDARSGTSALHAMYGRTRDAGFGREVKRRILLGTFVLSSGYYEAYYAKAQKVRALIRRDFTAAFEKVDVIAAPTAPTGAFRLGEKTRDPLAMYLSDVYTLPASLAGIPASSVPCGRTGSGLPVGLQLLAPHLAESRLFTVMAAVEREPS